MELFCNGLARVSYPRFTLCFIQSLFLLLLEVDPSQMKAKQYDNSLRRRIIEQVNKQLYIYTIFYVSNLIINFLKKTYFVIHLNVQFLCLEKQFCKYPYRKRNIKINYVFMKTKSITQTHLLDKEFLLKEKEKWNYFVMF